MSGFLVVAATLLDLKAARLLPSAQADDEDLAMLEARDLLFARLLEYKAYQELAGWFAHTFESEARFTRRTVAVPPEFVPGLPRVVMDLDLEAFVRLASRALDTPATPSITLDHIHPTRIDVAEHAVVLSKRLAAIGGASFRDLCVDCVGIIEVVARFLAVLDLFRDGRVAFDQLEPLAPLQVRWVHGARTGAERSAVTA